MKLAVAVLSFACLAACSTAVSGSPAAPPGAAAAGRTTTEPAPPTSPATRTSRPPVTTTTRTTTTKTTPRLPAPPTAIDQAANQQYCPGRITGALGKPMTVVVVETPNGRVNCDQAGAVLAGYYAKRRDPEPGSTPIE